MLYERPHIRLLIQSICTFIASDDSYFSYFFQIITLPSITGENNVVRYVAIGEHRVYIVLKDIEDM